MTFRQTETQTADPLVLASNFLTLKLLLKSRKHNLRSLNQISVEEIQAGVHMRRSEIHKLTNSVLNKKELQQQWKESIIVPICKMGDKTECSNYGGTLLFPTIYTVTYNIILSRFIYTWMKLLEITSVYFGLTDKIPIKYSAFFRYWRKM
jgi:hypothetical protein